MLNRKRTEIISSKFRNETRKSMFPTLIQYGTRIPTRAIKHEKERKVIQIKKEEVKLSWFADDIILYLKDTKDSIKTS
jgi:methyl coenzyme M reductase subunit D